MRQLVRIPVLSISLLWGIFHLGVAWNNNHAPIRQGRILTNRVESFPHPPRSALHPASPRRQSGWITQDRDTPFDPFVPSRSVAVRLAAEDGENNSPEEEEETGDEIMRTPWGRIKGYFLQGKEDDGLTFQQRLAKMGVATVLSYGMISNLSYAILIALAWYGFSAKTKLSPLAPGQWKPFLGVYAGFWVFNNVIRPIRLGLSVAVAPSLDNLVLFFQNKLKVSKPLAITVTVVVVNVFGTIALMCGGIALASLLAGVPIWA